MKIFRILMVLAFVFGAFGLSGSANAGAFTYTTGIQVQNLEGTAANITVAYYNQSGTQATSVNDVISANGSETYFPIHAADGFNGSVVISSDKQVASVVNVLGNGGAAGASYVGSSQGSTTVNIPLLMKENSVFSTWYNVQNTGSSTATVNVAYSDGTNVGPISIPAGASATFDQKAENHTQKVFSAVVTSDVPVAVAVIEESTTLMFAYSGFPSGSTNPVMPLINANNGGFVTGVQIQNAGDVATTVTVEYTPIVGTACAETRTIAAKASETFAFFAFANDDQPSVEDCVGGAKFVGSAKVTGNTANTELVAIVNQLGAATGGAYGGFDPATANNTVVMPLIMDRVGTMDYFTGFNVMNVGGTTTTVTCTFTGSSVTVSGELAPGAALNDLQGDKLADPYVGAATCTASGDGKIQGIVNEIAFGMAGDTLLVYEGINP